MKKVPVKPKDKNGPPAKSVQKVKVRVQRTGVKGG